MKWDDLRFFLALARTRTLAGAAGQLGVDATTVGRRLDRLAASLNSTLFEPGATGFALTASGDTLMRHAEEVERSIMAASGALTGERSRLAGTVRISLSEGFASWVVAPGLASFSARHPDIRLEIATTNGFLNPSRREADLAVMLARPAKGPLVSRKLTDYGLSLYAARDYITQNGTPASKADLRDHPLIGYIPDFIYAEELRYLAEIDDNLAPSLSSSSINVQHAMTRAGAGIAVLPDFIGQHDPQLQCLLPESVHIRRSFWIVVHHDLRRVARVAAVIDWLDELVAERLARQGKDQA